MAVRVVAPPAPFITVEEAKVHLRVESNDYDDYIGALIDAATGAIDGPMGWLGRCIGPQTLELSLTAFGGSDCWRHIDLPFPPFIDTVSVIYADAQGADTTWQAGSYRTYDTGAGGWALAPLYGQSWPTVRRDHNAVRVQYRAGYVADPTADPLVPAIPASIRHAVLLMVGDLWAHRETSVEGQVSSKIAMVPAAETLLSPYRIWRV